MKIYRDTSRLWNGPVCREEISSSQTAACLAQGCPVPGFSPLLNEAGRSEHHWTQSQSKGKTKRKPHPSRNLVKMGIRDPVHERNRD